MPRVWRCHPSRGVQDGVVHPVLPVGTQVGEELSALSAGQPGVWLHQQEMFWLVHQGGVAVVLLAVRRVSGAA